ncbi:MAG: iron-containing alcohol dehydrogenase [Candidatus Tectomicrobia bacterium]|uniref:Iron-containing alcohol dehydrogenase n=1 Tax=Tectimicrobiota bacterium TaxID=2528274 RepID=A0A937W502_UNCTE|nr:iron-containing alcohol dehydrogenase [Candidatus Tectomicrobia bacterium]
MELAQALQYRYSSVAQEIVCDTDAIAGLCGTLDRLGAGRAMIVCGPSILRSANVIQRVQEALGTRAVGLFAGVAPHAPVQTLQEAVEVAREARPEALISVGGGSTHDTSKGIATLLAEGGTIHDYEIHFEPPDKVSIPPLTQPKIPILTVPTTMGGAELSRGAGFTDKALGRKIVVSDPGTIPRSILIDGKALATTPTPILVSTAMGQFRIAVETVYSRRHNPIGDALALHAITMLVRALPRCAAKALPDLLHIKTAACMASLASVGGLGLNTAIAHHVGGLYNVPHGEANAMLLPHTMRFNLKASAERQALIAEAMGLSTTGMSTEAAGLAAADAVAQLCQHLGLPARLRDVDVPEAGLEAIAAATLHDRALATNPRPIADAGPILSVLRAAW